MNSFNSWLLSLSGEWQWWPSVKEGTKGVGERVKEQLPEEIMLLGCE